MSLSHLSSWLHVFFRRFYFDIWRKLIALLLALVTWFGVRWYLMQQQTLRVQVRVEYDSSRYHISADNHVFTVWLTVRRLNRDEGTSDWTEPLNYDLCVCLPDDLEVSSGEYRFTLNDMVAKKKPENVSFLGMEPEVLTVNYDRLETKTVRVRLPEDVPLGVRKVVFGSSEPSDVRLTGPSEYLKNLGEVLPDTSGVRSLLRESVPENLVLPLKRPYAQVQVVPSQVTLALHQEQVVRDMTESFTCPVQVLSLPSGYRVSGMVPAVEVTVSGAPGVFESWQERHVLAYADCAGIRQAGSVVLPVGIGGIPSGLRYVVTPSSCSFSVASSEAVPAPGADEMKGNAPTEGE